MNRNVEFTTADGLTKFFDGLSTKTLANLRSQGRGPRYFKRGRRVFYRLRDVETWLTACEVNTTDQNEDINRVKRTNASKS